MKVKENFRVVVDVPRNHYYTADGYAELGNGLGFGALRRKVLIERNREASHRG